MFDSAGWMFQCMTYDAAGGGTVVNEVSLTYNGWQQVTKSEQEHAGAVVPGITKAVQYGCSAGTGSTFPRPSSLTYPSGRVVYYNKPASGIGAAINRLDNVADDASGTTKHAQYGYLGDGTVVTAKRPPSRAACNSRTAPAPTPTVAWTGSAASSTSGGRTTHATRESAHRH